MLGVSANADTNTGYVVVKYAPNGNQLWVARYDSTNFPTATPTGFALDNSNNVIVTGTALIVKFDGNGNQLWTAPYSAQAVAVDSGQDIYVTGVAGNFTTSKLNPTGSNLWSQTWPYQGLPNLSEVIALDLSANVYVAGRETAQAPRGTSEVHIGILKYDTTGSQLWKWTRLLVSAIMMFESLDFNWTRSITFVLRQTTSAASRRCLMQPIDTTVTESVDP